MKIWDWLQECHSTLTQTTKFLKMHVHTSMPAQDSSREGALAKILTSKYNHGLQICVCSCSI